ncbi:MAG: DNA repair exonuclease, partial [Deltaproteobacteria bacterium]|nr:DNA repair exonuclease [Deltaproteobacteria bacterium]
SLRLPENVTVLSTERAQTIRWDDLGIAIHGRGFGRRAEHANIAATYPDAISGSVNIGLLHTSLAGSAAHDTYAPCVEADLAAKGYDYWALGHVHTRALVRERPWIVYPGNTQGRHAREPGAKGAMLVRVKDGRIESPEFRALDVARWETVEIDTGDCSDGDDVIERVERVASEVTDASEGRPVAMRFRVVGTSDAHRELAADRDRWTAEARRVVTDATRGRGWLEKVEWATRAPATVEPETDFGIDLARLADDPDVVAAAFAKLAEDDGALRKKLPLDARLAAAPPTGEDARAFAGEACATLVARLAAIGGER